MADVPSIQFISLHASGAETTTQTLPAQTNRFFRGLHVYTDVTVAGTGSITPKIQFQDPVSGSFVDALVGGAIVTVSTQFLRIYPGGATTTNLSANECLPINWRVVVTANNANTITYSVSAELLP